jgi:hypothetical protein
MAGETGPATRAPGEVEMNANRVLLMQLSERTSAKGNAYLSGWLGKASVVAFRGEPDKHGRETWDLFVATPEPRSEAGQAQRPGQRPETVAQRAPARHQGGGDGWRGSQYRRPANDARRAPAADDGAFYADTLEDIGR